MIPPKIPKTQKHSEFFGRLFQLRDQIHLRHLFPTNAGKLGSFAEHSALNSFYESILNLADSLIESYQGKYGIVEINIPASKVPNNVIGLIKEFAAMTEKGAYDTFEESWIKNQLDGMSELAYSTIYKLENLK